MDNNTYYVKRPEILGKIGDSRYVLLEASAGTGKTYTMASMVADLVIKGHDISSILLMTFTELATKELKERIRSRLNELLRVKNSEKPESAYWAIGPKERERLKMAINNFDSVNINTIHGFCRSILASFPILSGKALSDRLVDEKNYLKTALSNTLRAVAEGRPEDYGDAYAYHLLAKYLQSSSGEKLLGHLSSLLTATHDYKSPLEPSIYNRAENKDNIDLIFRAAFEIADIINALRPQKKFPNTKLSRPLLSALGLIAGESLSMEEKLAVIVSDFRTSALELLPDLRDKNLITLQQEATYIAALKKIPSLYSCVIELLDEQVKQELSRLKFLDGATSFDDLLKVVDEKLAAKETGPLFCKKLREKYPVCLIDEFQDTDPCQWSIFKSIYLSAEAQKEAVALYLVGDPKQAIYAFRGADVNTYLIAREFLASIPGSKQLFLDTNYRASGEMVSAINGLFAQETPETSFFKGKITYPKEQLKANYIAIENYLAVPGKESCHLPPLVIAADNSAAGKLSAGVLKKRYGRWLAQYIKEMLLNPPLVVSNDQGKQPLRARDIYILGAKRDELQQMATYLAEYQVPYVYYKEGGLFSGDEVLDFIDLLKAIAAPYDEKKRLKALIGPFFNVPLTEVAKFKELPANHPIVSRLISWQQLAEHHNFAALMADIMDKSGIAVRLLALKESHRELKAYWRIAAILAGEAAEKDGELSDLIEILYQYVEGKRLLENPDADSRPQESGKDAVTLLTMHKAKGLEAQVVAIYGGFSNPKYPNFGCPVIWTYGQNGKRCLYITKKEIEIDYAPPAGSLEILLSEARGEKERLMYVALTRAKRQLILPTWDDKALGSGSKNHLGQSYCQLINERLNELLKRPDEELKKLINTYDITLFNPWSKEAYELRVRALPRQINAANAIEEAAGEQPPAELTSPESLINSFLGQKEHFAGPLITSYTRMKKAAEQYDYSRADDDIDISDYLAPKSAASADSALPKGANFGNLIHKILEKLDYRILLAEPGAPDAAAFISFAEWQERCSADLAAICQLYHFDYLNFKDELDALIYRTLTRQPLLAAGPGFCPFGALKSSQRRHEVEFYYPIRSAELSAEVMEQFSDITVEKGYVKGYIDLLFEYEGKVYVLDWKSDTLPAYDEQSLKAHVAENYAIQIALYSLALYKMLLLEGKNSPQNAYNRFGGLIYCFVRGEKQGEGLYFVRPSFAEIEENYHRLGVSDTLAAGSNK